MIMRPNCCLHIEFKDKLTKISASQVKRHAELAEVGTHVHICRKIESATTLVEDWIAQNHVNPVLGLSGHAGGAPEASGQALNEGGDADAKGPALRDSSAKAGAGQSNPEPAPKLWRAKSRDLGDVVVSRN